MGVNSYKLLPFFVVGGVLASKCTYRPIFTRSLKYIDHSQNRGETIEPTNSRSDNDDDSLFRNASSALDDLHFTIITSLPELAMTEYFTIRKVFWTKAL